MIDQNSQFMAILTNVGAAKLANANALGLPWKLTALGVGDANGTDPVPSATQTKLINECRRAPLNQLTIDPVNPAVIIAEQVIPADVGGWWLREIGLYDEEGDLVAVSNCAPSFKPLLDQGSGRTQIVRMNFIVSSITNVVLKIDPAIVLATRDYVDRSIDAVLPGNKAPGTYRRVTINKYGIVQSGDNPTTLAGYGITDALRVGVASQQYPVLAAPLPGGTDGSGNGGALQIREAQEVGNTKTDLSHAPRILYHWQGFIAKDLAMSRFGDLLWGGNNLWHAGNFNPELKANKAEVDAALADKANKGTNLAAYNIGDAFTKDQVTAAIAAAIASLVNSAPGALDTLNELAAALGNDPNFATTMTNALAAKANKSDVLTAAQVNAALAQCIKLGQIVLNGSNPVFQSNGSGGIASITEGSGVLQVSGGDLPSSAVMCFHRPGSYGAMFGLDTDNQLKVGGWSMGALAHTIWHSGNRPKDTALLAPTGWSKNADTGEINQWIEYVVGDTGGATVVSVTWPFKFPSQCLNVRPSLRLAANAQAGVSVSFSDHTATGCTVRIEEWAAVIQTGLVLVVEARGL